MAAGYVDLYLDQGSTFDITLMIDDANGDPFDLTDYTSNATMKRSFYSKNPSLIFSVDLGVPKEGIIILTADPEITKDIIPGTYVYDVVISKAGFYVYRILEGRVFVSPGVSI